MKIGFSLSRCLKDILDGKVKKEDVLIIIARTYMLNEEHVVGVMKQYMWQVFQGYDEQVVQDTAMELYKGGKIHQPRVFNQYAPIPSDNCIWMDLAPTASSDSPFVQEAWDQYVMALRLMEEGIPEDEVANRQIQHGNNIIGIQE